MKEYKPKSGTIKASVVVSVKTIASLDDSSTAEVLADTQPGDYVVQNADGSTTVDAKADFENRFEPV